MSRAERKLDHIQHALSTGQSGGSGFDDIRFVHQALPDSSVEDVTLHSVTGGLSMSSPFYINAMTGGGGIRTMELNAAFARAAGETGIALAVGSQMSALKDPSERETYAVVRKENPEGLIFANLGSEASVSQAKEAVDMIEANALQIHLNVIQELAMPEGDRDFRGALERIQAISEALPVPVIVKETGFGVSREAAGKLAETSVQIIDAGGYGGTNFSRIENNRQTRERTFFNEWGIPSAVSVIEAAHQKRKPVFASGGIRNSFDILKSLSLGASAAGVAGVFLKILSDEGEQQLIEEIRQYQDDLKMMMAALGCRTIDDLQKTSVIISGETYHWLKLRGLNPERFASRS
ncbi:type 2 isopentenyl-diphosphate Delta-isomerase [Jeotgalibacillus aurantiacus]|uniref:type 2 isopentenyl-diphosphate Delta-isomerase n=1 Tax=Jeotgalibacillus aurantiacus TaxID=2763266 RepID=UPI001D0B6F8A|nr:type 2 isopentenyl-diphosphate Delta-isomerase [Jeotgalibacillus aurantiacus]